MARIPNGLWMFFNNLPPNTTNESLSAWFNEQRMTIPPDHIDCVERRDGDISATVCIPRVVTAQLLKWYLGRQQIEGRPLEMKYTPPPYERR